MARCLFFSLTRGLAPAAAAALVLLGGCDKHDIGQDCPLLLGDQDPESSGGTRQETQETVEVNLLFPCDEVICVATGGRSGYCSKRCREDSGCPDGFSCRTVQELGPFAGDKFCVWKQCAIRTECGPKEDFCCVPAPTSKPGDELFLCEFKKDDVTCRERLSALQ